MHTRYSNVSLNVLLDAQRFAKNRPIQRGAVSDLDILLALTDDKLTFGLGDEVVVVRRHLVSRQVVIGMMAGVSAAAARRLQAGTETSLEGSCTAYRVDFLPDGLKIIQQATAICRRMNGKEVTQDHLLLSFFHPETRSTVAAKALAGTGADLQKIYRDLTETPLLGISSMIKEVNKTEQSLSRLLEEKIHECRESPSNLDGWLAAMRGALRGLQLANRNLTEANTTNIDV